MRIVCISDTHGHHAKWEVPDGDILVHAGDLTDDGDLADVEDFDRWLGTLPHRHKIVIAGNHDFCFQQQPDRARQRLSHATYLQDEAVVIDGVKFYGSPWQPWFFDWAFNLPRGADIAAKWALIPADTTVLVTHGPPLGIGDLTKRGDLAGCADLLARVQVVRPKLHVFGHIHEAAGVYHTQETLFVNAAIRPGQNRGTVVDLTANGISAVD
ncbi:metallophosphatase domain-containing protein [Fimbriiglobus ruber]|uniref:Calcineurin-like phosphoesterase domain-containing protein n=1 Tax=Fimbriiglobus ruber TaxID=1908690 RepID=A0A225CYL2_9BACT|nr:metallophosphatase domain-containing protein [Fimbriiglobus ruber]OWK34470.1 hypothetical protein FRUB_10441 [Fimbriiglobus ruber]